MGTRSAIAIVKDGKMKASYNHYDGYPTGVGADLQRELQGVSWDEIKAKASTLVWVDSAETPTPEHVAAVAAAGFKPDPTVGKGGDYYSLLREQHGSLMGRLKVGVATDESTFPTDSLFCEYAYLFDLDKEVVEILKGLNKNRSKEHRLCVSEEGADYKGCARWWKGSLEEFLALDMAALENGSAS
jgi:hypothetical protein